MDNQEKLTTLGTEDTTRRQTKHKTQHRKQKNKKSNSNPIKNRGMIPDAREG